MSTKIYRAIEYGAKSDGKTICTNAIQKAIEDAAKTGGCVILDKGIYLTGSIFLKSNVEFRIEEGAELRGIIDEEAYPDIGSRVAGIEMNWPSGLINVFNQKNVKITGKGLINGQGNYWWNKYWGEDKLGGMREIYDAQGLRWVADYDCKRPRNIIVFNSSNIEIQELRLIRSPFWNVHICYSDQIRINGLDIRENQGPSTDGIDIDSSSNVIVENCYVDCNDDNFCIKAGRDADGLRVNRPAENIIIRNCGMGHGEGITLGSETSGGIRNVEIYNIKANKTDNGFRLKSAKTRGGVIENISVHDIEMTDVINPFSFELNWNPSYSYCEIPKSFTGEIPNYWETLSKHVDPPELGIPKVQNIQISDVKVNSVFVDGTISKAFFIDAYIQKPISYIGWKNIDIKTNTAGLINNATNWTMENVVVNTLDGKPVHVENCLNVDLPRIEKIITY